jgi:hypothetical protein
LLGVLGALEHQLAGQLVGREDTGAKPPQLEAGYEGLAIST